MGALLALVIAIVIISAVVGAIAQFLNKLNEANMPAQRRPGGPRQADRDMDRFLAEIDRLRKKNAEAAGQPQEETAANPTARPVARPVERPRERDRSRDRENDRTRPRVVAELAETPPRSDRRVKPVADGFRDQPPLPPPQPSLISPEELPVAVIASTPVLPLSPKVTATAQLSALRPRVQPEPQSELAQTLVRLLNSGQGPATALILMEILGPPKCKRS